MHFNCSYFCWGLTTASFVQSLAWRSVCFEYIALHRLSHLCAACFNVTNGDIGSFSTAIFVLLATYTSVSATEDAPAPNAIHSFQAHVANGKVHVTADPTKVSKENMSRPPRLLATGAEVGGPGVVIVGGGSAAFHTIESLREVHTILGSLSSKLMIRAFFSARL